MKEGIKGRKKKERKTLESTILPAAVFATLFPSDGTVSSFGHIVVSLPPFGFPAQSWSEVRRVIVRSADGS